MYYYAFIDPTTYVCYDVYESEEPIVDDPYCIEIDSLDKSYIIRKKYIDGEWVNTTTTDSVVVEARHISLGDVWLDDKVYELEHEIDSHTHTGYATETALNTLSEEVDGKAEASHTHAISNVSGLQSALDGKSATSHNHTAESIVQMADALFGTNYLGGVEYSYGSGSGKNILTEISNMPQGLHTVYAISGTTGNPKTTESFRYLIHKTSGTIGWILAWDAQGSLFTNYQSAAGTFKGWKCVYDAAPSALWTGGYYMSSSNGTPQTVAPSKKLSECRNGWVLIWSDYDADTNTKNNTDIHHDYVFKKNCAGANWSGQCMLCDIPRYIGSNSQDVDTERRILKAIYIHDDRIEGSYQGSYDERNDVVLRAVYEF